MMLKEIALILSTSLLFSMGFAWLGQPYVLGYIATGMFLGPLVKLINNSTMVGVLGHFGMLMLLFIVGMEFDLVKFRKIWKKAFFIVALQLFFSLIVAFIIRPIFGLCIEYALLIAFLLTLSSTAVVVTLLEEMKEMNSKNGSLVLSILIVQDLILIPMMLILRSFETQDSFGSIASNLIISIGLLVTLIIYLGQKSNKLLKPIKSMFQGSNEMMTLASVAFCFGCSAVATALGLSGAYGAFVGGLIIGSFGNKKDILQIALPISSILIMMFFISIGSQMDVEYIVANLPILALLSVGILFIKVLLNFVILRFFNSSIENSFVVAAMLSQASEFSFTLILLLAKPGILTASQSNMLNSLVIISLTLGTVFPVVVQSIYKKMCENASLKLSKKNENKGEK